MSKTPSFYSDEGIAYWKRRMRELAHEEEETSKELARKARRAKTIKGVETEGPSESGEPLRMVRVDEDAKRPPHNQQEVSANEGMGSKRDGAVSEVPQVRRRNRSPRKPNKGSNVPEVCQAGDTQVP